jgi:hypothetical protein
MEYPQLKLGEDSKLWLAAASREIGRLGQGKQPDMPIGSNTMHFLDHRDLPAGHEATYLRIVAAIKMHKVETHRIRFTVGGNRIDYKGKVSTPTANLETIKILLNSTVSTLNAKMLTANIESFYVGTPMDCYEYMRIPAKDIPADIMEQYNLAPLVHNSHVLTEIRKGMYGRPQAGILAYNRLVQHLALSNYTPVKHTHMDFSVMPPVLSPSPSWSTILPSSMSTESMPSISLQPSGPFTTSPRTGPHQCIAASLYNGTTSPAPSTSQCPATSKKPSKPTLTNVRSVPSMLRTPGLPPLIAHKSSSPHRLTPSGFLDAGGLTRIQQIIGTLLFYGRAINSTLLVALRTLSAA